MYLLPSLRFAIGFKGKFMKWILIAFLSSSFAYAGTAQFIDFFDSLEQRYLMNTTHLHAISQNIKLKKMGLFSPRNAEATYTPATNTISLKKEYMVKEGRGYRVKNFSEFDQGQYNLFTARATTIFHELSHGDFDVYIDRNRHLPMYQLLNKKLPTWFKKNYQRVNTKTATHELFGYTAGDYIFNLAGKIQSILSQHGLYYDQDKCFSQKALENIAAKLDLVNDLSFKSTREDVDFAHLMVPNHIYINGNDLDVSKLPSDLKIELAAYFVETYDLPNTYSKIVHKLNQSKFFSSRLEKCYSFLK